MVLGGTLLWDRNGWVRRHLCHLGAARTDTDPTPRRPRRMCLCLVLSLFPTPSAPRPTSDPFPSAAHDATECNTNRHARKQNNPTIIPPARIYPYRARTVECHRDLIHSVNSQHIHPRPAEHQRPTHNGHTGSCGVALHCSASLVDLVNTSEQQLSRDRCTL